MTRASRATVDGCVIFRRHWRCISVHQCLGPFHVRHNERTAQQSALLFSPDRIALCANTADTQPTIDERCRRASDALHVLRRTHASAISGGSRIQRRGRVSDMLRHRNHEGSRPFRLVPDESKSIDEGAMLPWGSLMWDLMKQVCGAVGVRTNVPFNQLTEQEQISCSPAQPSRSTSYTSRKRRRFRRTRLHVLQRRIHRENALTKAKDERGLNVLRVPQRASLQRLPEGPDFRTRPPATYQRHQSGSGNRDVSGRTRFLVGSVPESLEPHMRTMASAICESFLNTSRRLLELGLGYLSLDRAGATLSTGERQRVHLPAPCAIAPQACYMCWMSRRLGLRIPRMSTDCSVSCVTWWLMAIPW